MKFYDHPSTHGHDVNMDLCGVGLHRICSGLSGDYESTTCGCCCHDPDEQLTPDEKAQVARVRSLEWFLADAPPGLVKPGEEVREQPRTLTTPRTDNTVNTKESVRFHRSTARTR